jgi:hypothetical protein
MTTLTELFQRAESAEFSAKANIASGLTLFLGILEEDDTVRSLVKLLKDQPHWVIDVLSRTEQLARLSIDPRYENPSDVALATYCWALQLVHPQVAKIGANFAAHAQGAWWARLVALRVLREDLGQQRRTNSAVETKRFEKMLLASMRPEPNLEDIPITFVRDVSKYLIVYRYLINGEAQGKPIAKLARWSALEHTSALTFDVATNFVHASTQLVEWR